jgi:hypothetical protein
MFFPHCIFPSIHAVEARWQSPLATIIHHLQSHAMRVKHNIVPCVASNITPLNQLTLINGYVGNSFNARVCCNVSMRG